MAGIRIGTKKIIDGVCGGKFLERIYLGSTKVWGAQPDLPTPFELSSASSFTLRTYDNATHWDGTLEFSTDDSQWTEWDGTTISAGLYDGKYRLWLRGSGNTRLTSGDNTGFVLNGAQVFCSGSVEYLLEYEDAAIGVHPTMGEGCFRNLFYGCTALASAPQLPARTLASRCYSKMFYGCTALTSAPQLPARTLAMSCYYEMFRNCTSLASAPQLPARTLAQLCYYSMFEGCTALTSAPRMPATTLAKMCCGNMFYGCSSLTELPALPATGLEPECFYYMFYECSQIRLSTSQDATYGTPYRIPFSGTGTDASNALASMFGHTGGTFKGTPTINTTYYTSNTVVEVS